MRLLIPRLTMVLLCQAVAFSSHHASGSAQGPSDATPISEPVAAELIATQLTAAKPAPTEAGPAEREAATETDASFESNPGNETGPTVAEIEFVQTRFDRVREGYQSLQWNEIAGATRYLILDSEGNSYYEGALPEAFISGLSDGEHSFMAQAFSADNRLVGASVQSAVMLVDHWPMSQAWASFGVGLIVFLAMIGLIAAGALRASKLTDEARAVS